MNPYLSPAQPAYYDGEQPADPPKTFTQADLDRIIQKRVGKLEKQISDLQTKAGQDAAFIDELKATHETEKSNWQSEAAARNAELQAQLSAKDETIKQLNAKADSQLISAELDKAARAGDAVNAELIGELLASKSSVIDGKVIVRIGEYHLSPPEAVEFMRNQPERYGNLFRLGVPGIGASGAPAGTPAQSVDVKKLSPENYRRLRSESPRQLGFNS